MLRYFGVIANRKAGDRGLKVRIGKTDYTMCTSARARETAVGRIEGFLTFCDALQYRTCPTSLRHWGQLSAEKKPAAAGFSVDGYHVAWVERCCRLVALANTGSTLPVAQRATIGTLATISVDMNEHVAHMFPTQRGSVQAALRELDFDGDPVLLTMWTCIMLCKEVSDLHLNYLQECSRFSRSRDVRSIDG